MIIPDHLFFAKVHALMLMPERYLLWSLVFSKQPKAYLEIGSGFGGSAALVCDALDRLGAAAPMVLIDNKPQIDGDIWDFIQERATMIPEDSLLALPKLATESPRFDFVFVDGDHTDLGTFRDLDAVTAVLDDQAYVLVHDANNADVKAGIDRAVDKYMPRLVDCGILSSHIQTGEKEGEQWAGLRLLLWNGV